MNKGLTQTQAKQIVIWTQTPRKAMNCSLRESRALLFTMLNFSKSSYRLLANSLIQVRAALVRAAQSLAAVPMVT